SAGLVPPTPSGFGWGWLPGPPRPAAPLCAANWLPPYGPECARPEGAVPGCEGPGCARPGCEGPGCEGPGCEGPGCEGPGCARPGWARPGWARPGCEGPGCARPGWARPGCARPGWAGPGWGDGGGVGNGRGGGIGRPSWTARTASASSAPSANRWRGSLARIRITSACTGPGTSGGSAGGTSLICIIATVTGESARNGSRPARHSYATTPRE